MHVVFAEELEEAPDAKGHLVLTGVEPPNWPRPDFVLLKAPKGGTAGLMAQAGDGGMLTFSGARVLEVFTAHIVAKSMVEICGKSAMQEATRRALAAKAACDAETRGEWNQVLLE